MPKKEATKLISAVLFLSLVFWNILSGSDVFPFDRLPDIFDKQTAQVPWPKSDPEEANTTTRPTVPEGMYRVIKVVDGDTITIEIPNVTSTTSASSVLKETIRLIGINSPESVDPRKSVECFGKEASNTLKSFLEGRNVRIVSDSTQTDKDRYGRLLRYVYRDDGLFVNKYMIDEGFAYEYTYQKPYIFQMEFKQAQVLAQEQGKGLWAENVCVKK